MDGFDSIAQATFIVGLLFGILALLSVILRFGIRVSNKKTPLGLDDYFLIPGLIGMYAYVGLTSWGIFAVRRLADLENGTNPNGVRIYLKSQAFNSQCYFFSIAWAKLSIVFLYRRLFNTPFFKRVTAGLSILLTAWMIVGVVTGFSYCIPLAAFWDHTVQGHCFDFRNYFLVMSLFEIITDVALLVLPLQVIAKLHLSTRKKILLGVTFILASFVILLGCLRLALLYGTGNQFHTLMYSELWTELQLGVAVICASLPLFRPLITKLTEIPNSIREAYGAKLHPSRAPVFPKHAGGSQTAEALSKSLRYGRMDNSLNDVDLLTVKVGANGSENLSWHCENTVPLNQIAINREVDVA
ncbi:hypothetical protein EV356DRAFT_510575 [Viridothelium virens]|uniref:Rhodopsin domain-containing protein n=1 Tax=Viridothelium virens TaxID=1048519 RepID=A0A6A6HHU9_VIRVR|nr:hypothetical protein EV356DRAFT_510575 [Viridothelium virens]